MLCLTCVLFVCVQPLTQEAFPVLNKHAERIAKEDQKFHRLVIAKEQALEMFKVSRTPPSAHTHKHGYAHV